MMKAISYILLVIIILTGILIWVKSLEYYRPDFSSGYLMDKRAVFDGIFKFGLYAHILTAPLALLIGTAQIFFRYEFTQRKLHGFLGNVYALSILFISAPGAFIMSLYAFGGWYGKSSFILLSILWFWFTYKGWISGRAAQLNAHRNYMLRSYVLTVSAVTLRIISFIFIHYFHWHGELAYVCTAWLSWVPGLILTELYIRMKVLNNGY